MIYKIRRWPLGCLLLFTIACNDQREVIAHTKATFSSKPSFCPSAIDSIKALVNTGDLLTRSGNDFTSFCFRQFCQHDRRFSHCGIASKEHDTIFIYHALGGEFNPDQRLVREPLSDFLDTASNNAFGLFRFTLSTQEINNVRALIQAAFNAGVMFDMKFDLDTDTRMYCSEFAAKMYAWAKGKEQQFEPSGIGPFRYYAPDNLTTDTTCREIYSASTVIQ